MLTVVPTFALHCAKLDAALIRMAAVVIANVFI
ncbi:hypothetical protein N185_31310 [Sinorhizobium sp. GW3]|jgi:hypothetical protein|nr:hypothetical protein N185_31310 [Sinorhizobium sp. GW3]KSV77178.1 hypothetical protein N182_24015 [Sinorhizobium sp. GL2]